MRLKRLFLLGVYTVSVSFTDCTIIGAELDEPLLRSTVRKIPEIVTIAERSHSPESADQFLQKYLNMIVRTFIWILRAASADRCPR